MRAWEARFARASLAIHPPTPGSSHGPEAVAIDPLGTFLARPTGYGGGWGGNDKDIHLEVIEATAAGGSAWRCTQERNAISEHRRFG